MPINTTSDGQGYDLKINELVNAFHVIKHEDHSCAQRIVFIALI